MIISHKHKFIFIKTKKTAGTSIEIALSKYCGPDDIITPISPEDEKIRLELGYRGPQNYIIKNKLYYMCDEISVLNNQLKPYYKYYNHVPASYIKNHVSEDVWKNYFKFCFERNPYDKAISRYHWSTRKKNISPDISEFLYRLPPLDNFSYTKTFKNYCWSKKHLAETPTLFEYLKNQPTGLISNWYIYTINDEIAVDFVGRYENMSECLHFIKDKIRICDEIKLPLSKHKYRKNKSHYSEILDKHSRAKIEKICANEISVLSYNWNN
ncbi:sulfotransferase family 2 domain-containing protein [Methanohalophilus profundi]|uniref:sulfotransferase family 2 domain-containing protein n=1 Tax=Methanohalophilus profundi TaxID=2138083 RepID=UPI00101C6201|nr:sulfotransferase family 2 domain-containing protein [Methanohalophilus profundi]